MSNSIANNIVPYILRPAFAKKLKSPTRDDINKLYTEISSKDESKPTFWEKRSLMDYLATSVLGVGVIGSIVGYLRKSKAVIGGAIAVAIAGIAGFIYKFIKTPVLEKLANTAESENTDVKPEVDLSGEMSPGYKQWLIDVKKEIYDQPDYSDRIQELSKRNDLSVEEKAELAGLKEFPNNPTMAQLVELENLEGVTISDEKREKLLDVSVRRNFHKGCYFFKEVEKLKNIPFLPVEKAALQSVRFMHRVHLGNLNSGDQEMLDRLKRMINEGKEAFLQDLKDLLKERPLNLLLSDESFKHVLYQRSQVVTKGGGTGRGVPPLDAYFPLLFRETNTRLQYEQEVLSTDEALEVFSNLENERQKLINKGETAIPKYDPNKVERGKVYIKGWWNKQPKFGDDLVYSNTVCQCIHGGGARLLKLILTGKHPGYNSENANDNGKYAKGIQVHPDLKHPADYGEDPIDRSKQVYSPRSEYYFDTPSLLFFRIEARYLDAQQNDYEASIRSEFLEHATDFRLENLVTGEVLQGATLKDIREAITKSKIGIGDL